MNHQQLIVQYLLLIHYFLMQKDMIYLRVGRYKFNKKLALNLRIANQVAANDIVNP